MKIYNTKLNILILIIYTRIVNDLDRKLKADNGALLNGIFLYSQYFLKNL